MDEEPPIRRRLAAILAADIAGYSRLMHADEAATVRDLKAHQSVILPLVGLVVLSAAAGTTRLSDLVTYFADRGQDAPPPPRPAAEASAAARAGRSG